MRADRGKEMAGDDGKDLDQRDRRDNAAELAVW
jgi:hypothetical protein